MSACCHDVCCDSRSQCARFRSVAACGPVAHYTRNVFPIVTTEGGLAIGGPDVLLPGMVGVNMADAANAMNTTSKVLVNQQEALVLTSIIPVSTGFPPGAVAGIISATLGKECRFQSGSAKVIADGERVVTMLLSMTTQNAANCLGIQLTAAQSRVLTAS